MKHACGFVVRCGHTIHSAYLYEIFTTIRWVPFINTVAIIEFPSDNQPETILVESRIISKDKYGKSQAAYIIHVGRRIGER